MTTAGTDTKTLGQKAVDRFTEMMIERMEQMKSVGWHKGWLGGATCLLYTSDAADDAAIV